MKGAGIILFQHGFSTCIYQFCMSIKDASTELVYEEEKPF